MSCTRWTYVRRGPRVAVGPAEEADHVGLPIGTKGDDGTSLDRVSALLAMADEAESKGSGDGLTGKPLAYFDEDATCGVCADERVAYFSVGCRHAACETCWRVWLSEHEGCWLCGTRVEGLRRNSALARSQGPSGIVSGDGGTNERARVRCDALRVASSKVLRRLVALKHRVMELCQQTEEVEAHLRALASPGSPQTLDAVGAVLAVEQRSLAAAVAALLAATGGPAGANRVADDSAAWRALNRDVGDALRSAKFASTALDAVEVADEKLRHAKDAAANLGVDTASAQWGTAKQAIESCARSKFPKYTSLLCGPAAASDPDGFMSALVGVHNPRSRRPQYVA